MTLDIVPDRALRNEMAVSRGNTIASSDLGERKKSALGSTMIGIGINKCDRVIYIRLGLHLYGQR